MKNTCNYGLRIGYWNIDGLRPKHQDKSNDSELLEFIQKNDISVLGETHFGEGETLKIPNYKTICIYRPKAKKAKRNFGGFSALVKNNICKGVELIDKRLETNYVWIKVRKEYLCRQQDLYIFVSYTFRMRVPRIFIN